MALRVLLADESVTIKKVFQLALQDYGVEVMSVHVGLDVLSVSQKFKPDIVFADVLLQKKNGYEVAAELRQSTDFKSTPIVLIWSNFMELDQAKFATCGANDHLEKPFDTERLRQLIHNLVPKTRSQKISSFLEFPKMPEFVEEKKAPETQKDWNMDHFDSLDTPDEFIQLDIEAETPAAHETAHSTEIEESDAQWVQKSLSKFKINPQELERATEPTLDHPINQNVEIEIPTKLKPEPSTAHITLSESELREIVRAEAIKLLEKVVWEIVPELATQIIDRELKRMIQENNDAT